MSCGTKLQGRFGSWAERDELADRLDRIWVLHCPFGAQINPVVIIPLETWKKLCEADPFLAATQFEVGSAS